MLFSNYIIHFFYPYLLYGLVAWNSTFPIHLHKLASIQNKVVKLIGEGHFLVSTTQFYAKLKILKLLDLNEFETAKLVHNYMNSKLPLSFSDYFNKSCDVSNRSTRISVNSYNLCKPLYGTNRMQRSVKYKGVKIWNYVHSVNDSKTSKNFF